MSPRDVSNRTDIAVERSAARRRSLKTVKLSANSYRLILFCTSCRLELIHTLLIM